MLTLFTYGAVACCGILWLMAFEEPNLGNSYRLPWNFDFLYTTTIRLSK